MKSPPKISELYGDTINKTVQFCRISWMLCYVDSNLYRELMAREVLKKISTKLNFLWEQYKYLNDLSKDCS